MRVAKPLVVNHKRQVLTRMYNLGYNHPHGYCIIVLTYCSAWIVGLHLSQLKEQYNKRKSKQQKKKGKQLPTWHKLLQDSFGAIVGGNLLQWANRRMRIYNTYAEEDIQVAHMDFTSAYNMLTFSDGERNKWLQIVREKLVTHAMLMEQSMYVTFTHTQPTYIHIHTHTHTHPHTHTHTAQHNIT